MSKSFGLIFGPVLYHPTIRSLAFTFRNIPYLCNKITKTCWCNESQVLILLNQCCRQI